MNVCIIGSGGREHALAWKIKQSPNVSQLYVLPGNGGTSAICQSVNIEHHDFDGILQFLHENDIQLLVVGPEDPLVNGIREAVESDDRLKNVIVVGPGKMGALLEGSKEFSKQFMIRHGIPTARAHTFFDFDESAVREVLSQFQPPFVVKADGLAAGKGVVISESLDESVETIRQMLDGSMGAAGKKVLIEEYLHGVELSVFILTDGKGYIILPEAKDYKRIGEKDTGLNTGGMGAVSPVPFADEAFMNLVEKNIIEPTLDGLRKEKILYQGFIFLGLMNVNGKPWVIEYNARMGDPETEAVMMRLDEDLIPLFEQMSKNTLPKRKAKVKNEHACVVFVVSGGYPGAYQKGLKISLPSETHGTYFHAGTQMKEGHLITSGGRVIAASSLGNSPEEARKFALQMAEQVQFDHSYFRKDIGLDLFHS